MSDSKGAAPTDAASKQAKREKDIRYPASRIATMVCGWWLLYLLANTNNPLAQMANIDPTLFVVDAEPFDYFFYIGSRALFLIACIALLWHGLGRDKSRQLLQNPQDSSQKMHHIIFFVCQLFVAKLIEKAAILLLPSNLLWDLPYVLEDLQYDSVSMGIFISATKLLATCAQQIMILTPLALAARLPITKKLGSQQRVATAIAYLFIVGGVLCSSPTTTTLLGGILSNGLSELACGWYFWRSHNLKLTILFSWGTSEALGFFIAMI